MKVLSTHIPFAAYHEPSDVKACSNLSGIIPLSRIPQTLFFQRQKEIFQVPQQIRVSIGATGRPSNTYSAEAVFQGQQDGVAGKGTCCSV